MPLVPGKKPKMFLPQLPKPEYIALQALCTALGASQIEVFGLGIRVLAATYNTSPKALLGLLEAKRLEHPTKGDPIVINYTAPPNPPTE